MKYIIDKSKINYVSIIGAIVVFIGMFLPVIEQNNILGQYTENTWQFAGGWYWYIICIIAIIIFAIKDIRIPCLVASILMLTTVGVPHDYNLIGQYVMLVGAIISLVGAALFVYKDISNKNKNN